MKDPAVPYISFPNMKVGILGSTKSKSAITPNINKKSITLNPVGLFNSLESVLLFEPTINSVSVFATPFQFQPHRCTFAQDLSLLH